MTGYNRSVGFSDASSRILFNAPPFAEPIRRGVDVPEGSAPMSAHSTGPTDRQRLVWEATKRHGKQAAAAAELGITHATLRAHLLAYMKATGEVAVPSYRPPEPIQRLMARISVNPSTGCWEWTGPVSPDGYGIMKFEGRSDGVHRVSWALHRGPIAHGVVVRHLVCDNPPCCNPDHLALGTQSDNVGDMVARGRARGKEQAGEANTSARLTDAVVMEMRARRRAGESFGQIGAAFGVASHTVRPAVRGLTWSHLPGPVLEASHFRPHNPNAAKTHCIKGHEFNPANTRVSNGRRACRQCHRERVRAATERRRDVA